MIVKNESQIITRCLDSLKDIITYAAITDTGSTDDTIAIIKNWYLVNNIAGVVHQEQFRNFGYNRTDSLNKARSSYPNTNYFLLSDADMVWQNHGFNSMLLLEDQYLVMQYSRTVSYPNLRLLSNKHDWECVGVTHEFWQAKTATPSNGVVMTTLAIDDRYDGGCKSDKYQRDIRLLTTALEEPTLSALLKSRYTFYLAQSLYDIGQYEAAIEQYQKRISYKLWEEEVFYSYYRIGKSYQALAEREENPASYYNLALLNYITAWCYRPSRAESLNAALLLYRNLAHKYPSYYDSAYKLALLGKTIPTPNSAEGLFVEYAVYDYIFDFELTIIAYYTNNKEVGREACLRLIARDDIPSYIMSAVERNCKYYI